MATKNTLRPSPPQSATEFEVGCIRTGTDGHQWIIVADKNGKHRWQKSKEITSKPRVTRAKLYLTHDNGGRPFKVTVTKQQVTVHTCPRTDEEDWSMDDYTVPVARFDYPKKVWVGDWNDGYEKDFFKGNCILLQLTIDKYVFIGERIYEFHLLPGEKVKAFVADVGNNDVPYPYLTTNKKHLYFLLPDTPVYVPLEVIGEGDPYQVYYGHEPMPEAFRSKHSRKANREPLKAHEQKVKIKMLQGRQW
jgi:hypothetical protein